MCGIAGILWADQSREVDERALAAMSARLGHRGPDAEGLWHAPGIGLAHRRLSIIDLTGGDQPIGNEDGSVQVICNGEIYNFVALREWLESRGHRFRTRSDTELLVHLYEEHGDALVERLRGMFAFALWDGRRRRLLLARDRVGIKPLYYYRDSEKLIFASEAKAILAYPGVRRDVDVESLEDFLALGVVPGPRSIFRNVAKLPPAHVLAIDANHWDASPRRYWELRIEPDHRPSADQWAESIRAKLSETVRSHLAADVPVGAFLSGGIDSAAVVACAAGEAHGMETFSIGFHEDAFNELPHAKLVAERFGTTHHEQIATPDAVGVLDELTEHFDEPFADAAALPTLMLSRLARSRVKVVLSGDGGDEAFGGYDRYAHDLKEAVLRRSLPGWLRRAALRPLARAWPKSDWLPRPLRAKTTLTNLALEPADAYANTLTLCRQPLRRRLLNADLAAGLNGHEPERHIRNGFGVAPVEDALAGMIAADVATLLPDDFLTKVDRAGMAHGLEVRPPLLDHELLELAARIPSHFKVRDGQTKWIFRQACAPQLPHAVTRRRKRGFDVPLDAWLRGPLRPAFEASVLSSRAPVAGLLNQRVARGVFRSHLAGSTRGGQMLWSMLVLARWAERYLVCSHS